MKKPQINNGDTAWVKHRGTPTKVTVLTDGNMMFYVTPRGSAHRTIKEVLYPSKPALETADMKGTPMWKVRTTYGSRGLPSIEKVTLLSPEKGEYSDHRSYTRWIDEDGKYHRALMGLFTSFKFVKTKKEALKLIGSLINEAIEHQEEEVVYRQTQITEAMKDLGKLTELREECRRARVAIKRKGEGKHGRATKSRTTRTPRTKAGAKRMDKAKRKVAPSSR